MTQKYVIVSKDKHKVKEKEIFENHPDQNDKIASNSANCDTQSEQNSGTLSFNDYSQAVPQNVNQNFHEQISFANK